MSNWNNQVIEEFRTNGGKVGGRYEGRPLLLLTTTGAKSGKRHTTPLGYLPDGNRLIIFAAVLGAPKNPAWYHNLVAHPEITVEVGTETFDGTAIVATGEERELLWARAAAMYPALADYQAKTTRQIPVIALQRSIPTR